MSSNYAAIIQNNIQQLFDMDLDERADALSAQNADRCLTFKAFGRPCTLMPDGVMLDNDIQLGPMGIVISLYAIHATVDACIKEPLRSFKELPDSMPYVGAFTNRTEQCLVPVVDQLSEARQRIVERLDGGDAPGQVSGDLSFMVRPLPKIALCYVCYLADDDFPATVTCLYSQNADRFLTTDALADLGEYTSKAIIDLISIQPSTGAGTGT